MSYTAIVEGDQATPAFLNAIFDQLDIEAAAASFTNSVTIAGILSVDDTTEATSTTAASVQTDGGIAWVKDAYVGDDMFFTSGAVLDFDSADVTLTHAANKLTLAGGDLHIGNGDGLVLGHSAQLTAAGVTAELQVLGTAQADSTFTIGRWSADVDAAEMSFYKSRSPTIGSFDDVTTGDCLGRITAFGDDGTDDDTVSARISFDSEGTVSTGQVPGVISFQTAAAGTLAVALTIDSTQNVSTLAVFLQSTVTTLADDATPSVSAGNLFKTGGTTSITDFDDGIVGQTIHILAAHSVTITDGAAVDLSGGSDYTMTATDTLILTMYNDQVWVEDGRSVNGG